MQLAPGDEVDRYVVEAQIGRGGVALVYRVRHRELGTLAALKVLQVPSTYVVQRLMKEGRIQSALRHPNVVAVLDVVQVGGAPALLAEYVAGASLARFMARHRATLDEADTIARDMLAGLAAAHAIGRVHRDVKPGNVLLDPAGPVPIARITDFGLAKALAEDGDESHLTAIGAVLGTPRYMAPEQVLDPSRVGPPADVFALGAVLFELVTGRRPFDTRTVADVIARREAPPPRPGPELDPRMAAAIEAALAPRPEDRPRDADELRRAWVGDAGPVPPERWTDAGRRAARLDDAPEARLKAQGPSNPTWSDSVTRATPTGDERPEPPGSRRGAPTPGAVVRAQRRWVPAGLLLAGLAAILAVWWGRDPEPIVAAAPTVSADPAVQAKFARGWAAFRAARLSDARVAFGDVARSAPEAVEVHVALALVLELDGDLSAGLEVFRDATRASQGRSEPAARVVALVNDAGRRGEPVVTDALLAELERGRDWLSHVFAARYCPTAGVEVCERVHARLDAIDRGTDPPGSALVALVEARAWRELGRADRARRVLAAVPDREVAPAIRVAAAEAGLTAGDAESARAALAPLLADGDTPAADPRVVVPALVAARMTGDDAAARRLADRVLRSERPLADHVAVLSADADVLVGLGRFDEARDDIRRRIALEQEIGTPLGEIRAWNELELLETIAADPAARLVAVDAQVDVASRRPDVSDGLRGRLAATRAFVEGELAASRGDRAGLQAARQALERADQPQRQLVARLRLTEAVLAGDAEAVAALARDVEGISPCQTAVVRAEAVRRAGAGADPALDAELPGCSWSDSDRAFAAVALAGRAEVAAAAGDTARARAALAAYDARWPAPDPVHPAAARAEAVRLALP